MICVQSITVTAVFDSAASLLRVAYVMRCATGRRLPRCGLSLGASFFFFFSSRRRHTRCGRDWSSDVCSSDLHVVNVVINDTEAVVGRTPGVAGPSTASVAITGGGNVAVAAASDESNQSRALPSDGGGKGSNVGVGASVPVNVPINTVNGEVADGTTGRGQAGTVSGSADC